MIHTATSTVKFRRLARAMAAAYGCSRPMADTLAVGHLERLWHLTISSAKRGDIGRVSDIEIADEVGWEGEPEKLIEILIETGWIDRSDDHRLLIHDWHEHAPGFIKRNIGKVGGFLTGSGKPELDASEDAGSDRLPHPATQEPPDLSAQARTPNQTKHNLTLGRLSKATKNVSTGDSATAADGEQAAIPPPDPDKALRFGNAVGKCGSRKDVILAWKLTALERVLGEAWFANITTALRNVKSPPRNRWAYVRAVAARGSNERAGPGKEGLNALLARVPPPPADWPQSHARPRETVPA